MDYRKSFMKAMTAGLLTACIAAGSACDRSSGDRSGNRSGFGKQHHLPGNYQSRLFDR